MTSVDEVERDLAVLLSTGEYSDVTFLVEGKELLAHRLLLASRSKYFRALLFGGLAESQQTKIELDVKLKPFKLILRYIYTGRVELEQLDDGDLIDLLGLVHEYAMEKLISAVMNILKGKLSLETCYWLFNNAVKYHLGILLQSCRIFWKNYGTMFVKHPSFNMLTEPALKLFMETNFYVDDIDIFMAAKSWCDQFPEIDPKSILAKVKYSRISTKDLVQKVKPTGLVDAEVLLQAIEAKFDGSINTIGHPRCISIGHLRECRKIPFTKIYNCIEFDGKYSICCIEFHPPLPIDCSMQISWDSFNWTKITDDVVVRTETRVRFEKIISSRYFYLDSDGDYNISIRGIPVWCSEPISPKLTRTFK